MVHIIRKQLIPLVCWLIHFNSGHVIRDRRCFLENGATASHLFVSEDVKVSETIGVVGVLGDPGANGDIELRLQEHDSPVTFSDNSKNLTLTRLLDKEGIDGPASVFVNVICERKGTLDPGFVIPVNIRVTDANDNAPQFINGPYVLNISEVTVVGTRVLQGVRAVDADQPGAYSTVQYAVLPGPYSHILIDSEKLSVEDYFVFVNALEGTLVLRKPLDYEILSNFSVGIRAQDQGNPPRSSVTTLFVNVVDADDQNPAFINDQYKVFLPADKENLLNIKLRVEPEPIGAVDKDVGIDAPVRYSIQGKILPFLNLNPETGEILASRRLLDSELVTPSTLVLKATQMDNPDRYALATLVVSREEGSLGSTIGGEELPVKFVLKDYEAKVPENTPPGSLILTAGVNKIDSNLRFWLVGATEDLQRFYITQAGELILKGTLDYERRIQHSFLVHVTDGKHNDTARVNVSVEDVNEWEPRFRHPRYEFHARTLRDGSIVGRLEAADGDRGDRVTLSLRGPDARSFEIRDNGELILQSGNNHFNGTLAKLIVMASDSGKPPRTSMIPVIVHLPSKSGLGSLPIGARGAVPAWLGSSVLLVAIFGALLGLLGVVILILILYIYKHKRGKSGGSVSSVGTGYREKCAVPAALSCTPQVLGAAASILVQDTILQDDSHRLNSNPINDVDNPVFGGENESSYDPTLKSVVPDRQISLYKSRQKVGPIKNPPALSATSNIPNINGLVENMNDLSARRNIIEAGSENSSNYSINPPDSLIPTWPAGSPSRRVKKLSWDDDDRMDGSIEIGMEGPSAGVGSAANEKLNLTVYF